MGHTCTCMCNLIHTMPCVLGRGGREGGRGREGEGEGGREGSKDSVESYYVHVHVYWCTTIGYQAV